MSVHIHIYGRDGIWPRGYQQSTRIESTAERRRRQSERDSEASRRITDRGGIDGTVRKSDRIGP